MNYDKYTWSTGDVVTASRLNNIEDGIANAAEAIDELDAEVVEKLDEFAKIDGVYESMTVGNAEQLVSTVGIEDATPYSFRTSGGSVDIGNREQVSAVVGGTVAWNQLVQNGDFSGGLKSWGSITGGSLQSQSVDDGVCTITVLERNASIGLINTNSKVPSLANHKVLFSVDINPSAASTIHIGAQNATAGNYGVASSSKAIPANTWTHYAVIGVVAAGNTASNLLIYTNSGGYLNVNDTIQLKNITAFDLTAMFGSTIADYIYSLEQANEGAGVAWFKKLFPNPYYEYNSGELLSVNTSQHKMVGFNALDPETGTAHVVGGMQYQITGAYTALSIDGETVTPDASGYFTPSEDGTLTVTGGNSSTTCVHLVWSGSRDGEYEPYEEWVYPLDDSLTLRGIPKLDASGNLYYDGDTYAPDGTVTRRYGVVDLGTLTWVHNSTWFQATGAVDGAKATEIGSRYTRITIDSQETSFSGATGSSASRYGISTGGSIRISESGYSGLTDAEFKAAMNGVYLVYELATPTTETATPYTQIQSVDDFGTEEYTDAAVVAGDRDVSVPVGSETYYFANLRDKLQHLPDLASADGDYIVRQTGTNMTLVPYADVHELPDAPTEDGTYTLQVTVANGTATLSWVPVES